MSEHTEEHFAGSNKLLHVHLGLVGTADRY